MREKALITVVCTSHAGTFHDELHKGSSADCQSNILSSPSLLFTGADAKLFSQEVKQPGLHAGSRTCSGPQDSGPCSVICAASGHYCAANKAKPAFPVRGMDAPPPSSSEVGCARITSAQAQALTHPSCSSPPFPYNILLRCEDPAKKKDVELPRSGVAPTGCLPDPQQAALDRTHFQTGLSASLRHRLSREDGCSSTSRRGVDDSNHAIPPRLSSSTFQTTLHTLPQRAPHAFVQTQSRGLPVRSTAINLQKQASAFLAPRSSEDHKGGPPAADSVKGEGRCKASSVASALSHSGEGLPHSGYPVGSFGQGGLMDRERYGVDGTEHRPSQDHQGMDELGRVWTPQGVDRVWTPLGPQFIGVSPGLEKRHQRTSETSTGTVRGSSNGGGWPLCMADPGMTVLSISSETRQISEGQCRQQAAVSSLRTVFERGPSTSSGNRPRRSGVAAHGTAPGDPRDSGLTSSWGSSSSSSAAPPHITQPEESQVTQHDAAAAPCLPPSLSQDGSPPRLSPSVGLEATALMTARSEFGPDLTSVEENAPCSAPCSAPCVGRPLPLIVCDPSNAISASCSMLQTTTSTGAPHSTSGALPHHCSYFLRLLGYDLST